MRTLTKEKVTAAVKEGGERECEEATRFGIGGRRRSHGAETRAQIGILHRGGV